VFCISAIASGQTVPAQSSGWQGLNRLRAGEDVRVVLTGGGTIEGRVERWSPEAFAIVAGNAGVRSLQVGEVKQVSVRRRGSRLKAAGIGAAIGFGAGFAIGASKAGFLADRNSPSLGVRAETGARVGALGGGIGALIGALSGGPRYRTIYTVP
jgi:hypothetical protein